MGGYVGGWVAKKGNWWLSRGVGGIIGGWVAKLVTATLWVRFRGIPQKLQKGGISKGLANTL
jgi:hypothetical protein